MSTVVVKRNYDSTLQRAAIWRGLCDEFQERKSREARFGRGRYLNLIERTVRDSRNRIRYDDQSPYVHNDSAISDSDIRDALRRDLSPGERWNTQDYKLQVYHAFLQLVRPDGFAVGDTSERYDEAARALSDDLGYLAGTWQAMGAELISRDLMTAWVGSIDLPSLGLNLGEEYECRFRMLDGEAFDGPEARIQAFTRHTRFKTAYMPNAIICFADPLPGGMRPFSACIYPLKGVLKHMAASDDFRASVFQSGSEGEAAVQAMYSHGLHAFFEKTTPLVFGGMAVPAFKNLGARFHDKNLSSRWIDSEAYKRGERVSFGIFGSDMPADRLLVCLAMIDQSIETSFLIQMFGINNELNVRARMQFSGHPLPLVNNIFFDLKGSMRSAQITGPELEEERTGRHFPPPFVRAYELSQIGDVYDLVEAQALRHGLELPSTDSRPGAAKRASGEE